MKVTKKDKKYIIELGRNQYYLLLQAVDFGAEWMSENGYSRTAKPMLKLLEKLKNVKE